MPLLGVLSFPLTEPVLSFRGYKEGLSPSSEKSLQVSLHLVLQIRHSDSGLQYMVSTRLSIPVDMEILSGHASLSIACTSPHTVSDQGVAGEAASSGGLFLLPVSITTLTNFL